MNFSFDLIDFCSCLDEKNQESNIQLNNNEEYDKTTSETYRIKRLYKIDPITDTEIPNELMFEFKNKWNPYSGLRGDIDDIGPLCFNAINLYDYYYINRYKCLWTPPQDGFQGIYGDMVGSGKNVMIKSRGEYPEKYLFRLPIIDCYLPITHNLSVVTMGPELIEQEITLIDLIVSKFHSKKSNPKFASLTMLKYYYDMALIASPDQNSDDIKQLKSKYPTLSQSEINQKYNRYFVDKLVNLKY